MVRTLRHPLMVLLAFTLLAGCATPGRVGLDGPSAPPISLDEVEAPGVQAEKPAAALPEAISAGELRELLAAGSVQVVDVRESAEFARADISGAINIFDEDFIFKAGESVARLEKSGRVVLVATTGARSASAYFAILATDYANKGNLQYLDNHVTYLANGSFEVAR